MNDSSPNKGINGRKGGNTTSKDIKKPMQSKAPEKANLKIKNEKEGSGKGQIKAEKDDKVKKSKENPDAKEVKEKKVFDTPGQTRETPPENDPLRKFYTTLFQQKPNSEMASRWCLIHGLLPRHTAEEILLSKGFSKAKSPVKPNSNAGVKRKTLESPVKHSPAKKAAVKPPPPKLEKKPAPAPKKPAVDDMSSDDDVPIASRNPVKKEQQPVVRKDPHPVVKKEQPPVVKKEEPSVVKKDQPPVVKKEEPSVAKKDQEPLVRKEIAAVSKAVPVLKTEVPVKKENVSSSQVTKKPPPKPAVAPKKPNNLDSDSEEDRPLGRRLPAKPAVAARKPSTHDSESEEDKPLGQRLPAKAGAVSVPAAVEKSKANPVQAAKAAPQASRQVKIEESESDDDQPLSFRRNGS